MRNSNFAVLSVLAFCLAQPALSAEIEAVSHIDAVTLYPDAALVTRIAEVDLPAGASRLILHGLPFALDPASLRASGQGETPVSLGAVDVRQAPAQNVDSALQAQIRKLNEERDVAQVKVDAQAAKQAMMQLYAGTGPEKLGDAKVLKPEDWGAAWDAVGAALAKTGEDLRLARAAVAGIDVRIKAAEAARPAPMAGGPARDVAIDVDAQAAGKFRLSLDYRVIGARWTPAYDARLETGGRNGKPKLELIRRAAVTQRTGEDWADVALSLAAFRATGGTQAPRVEPQVIAFFEPPLAVPLGAALAGRAAPMASAPPPAAKSNALETQGRLDSGAYQAIFHAAGRVSLSADGETRAIRLSAQAPQTELSWRASPALDPRVFISSHFVNGEDAPLLPGSVSLYRDGAFVGRGFVTLTAPNEAVDLGFGPDERVAVMRAPVKRGANEPAWFGRSKIETREFKTVLRNLHDFPIHAEVTDQAPFSENAAITVETLPQTTPPSETAPDGQRGVMLWRFDLAPDESKDIRLAYRMKWPADRNVIVP